MQSSKCSQSRYACRDPKDGTLSGWLVQLFEAINTTWPHPGHRLVNSGMMATGPDAYVHCLNTYVPEKADLVRAHAETLAEPAVGATMYLISS